MRLNKNQQETLMYQSRLLFKHDNVESASDRSLVLTIYTNEVFDTEHFKSAVFQKVLTSDKAAIGSKNPDDGQG